jgi:hypothetical protein
MVNGKTISEMVLDLKFGKMKTNIMVIGKMINEKERESLHGKMEIFKNY